MIEINRGKIEIKSKYSLLILWYDLKVFSMNNNIIGPADSMKTCKIDPNNSINIKSSINSLIPTII